MTSLPKTFKHILNTLTHAPESESLESQLADFAAKIGAEGQRLVYCQSVSERFLPVGPAVSLLLPYGIELRGEWKNGRRFIYACVGEHPSHFLLVSSLHELALPLAVAA